MRKMSPPDDSGEFQNGTTQHRQRYLLRLSYGAWYKDGTKYCKTPQDSTLGYYCPDCGLLVGVFTTTRPTGGFVGKFAADLDDNVDILPSKICPDCGMEMDIDYPRCPTCGYVFETK